MFFTEIAFGLCLVAFDFYFCWHFYSGLKRWQLSENQNPLERILNTYSLLACLSCVAVLGVTAVAALARGFDNHHFPETSLVITAIPAALLMLKLKMRREATKATRSGTGTRYQSGGRRSLTARQ